MLMMEMQHERGEKELPHAYMQYVYQANVTTTAHEKSDLAARSKKGGHSTVNILVHVLYGMLLRVYM